MRKLFILLSSLGTFYLIAASTSIPISSSLGEKDNISAVISSSKNNQCVDELHDTWFVDFMKYQEKGYSIKLADDLALKQAIDSYKNCE